MIAKPGEGREPAGTAFSYEELLAYYRGELDDLAARRRVQELVKTDDRWAAHWDSVRFLDLEQAAAVQDAKDLAGFVPAHVTPFCREVAVGGGELFARLRGGDAPAAGTREAWDSHVDECVYCRRMRRLARAREQEAQWGGLLLRDWLLKPLYADALAAVTAQLRTQSAPRPEVILIWTREGFSVVVINGERRDLRTAPPDSGAGWTVVVARSPPPRPIVTSRGARRRSGGDDSAAALPPALEFSRTLALGRGSLRVSFRVNAGGGFDWEAELTRTDQGPTLTLTVEVAGKTGVDASSEPTLCVKDSVPAGALRLGKPLQVRVRYPDETWEEYSFQLGE